MLTAGLLLAHALLAQPAPAPPVRTVGPEVRGDIMMAHKKYREAIEAYREAPQDSAVIANKMGIAYHQLTELGNSKRYYERAIKLNPKYAEAINNLGTVYYARRSYRKAIGHYKKALEFSPNSASIYSNLGTAYFARRKYEDAAQAWTKALSLDAEVFEHRSSQGVLLQERTVGERAKFHYHIAKLYAKAGLNERALLYMRKSIEEGFKEKKKFLEDEEFAALRELPEFKQILAMEPRVQ
ncbi:MAG: tetratricopeptide repeat protein [Acidobacteriales bacterium]|nr:tetratricopeptide repeat protein [Terriglobales bacterium]